MALSLTESERIGTARRFANDAATIASQLHCEAIVVLDVRGISPITDFFVIATGTSARQMRSVADEVAAYAAQHGNRALSTAGLESTSWILVDFVDVVVHLFSADARSFYDLDNLWGDARQVEWKQGSVESSELTK